MNPTIHVRILSPQQLILDTDAYSISSQNAVGPFDILPYHANFITVVENQPIFVRPARPAGGHTLGNKPLTFKFPVAVISVSENRVNIYTYILPQTN